MFAEPLSEWREVRNFRSRRAVLTLAELRTRVGVTCPEHILRVHVPMYLVDSLALQYLYGLKTKLYSQTIQYCLINENTLNHTRERSIL